MKSFLFTSGILKAKLRILEQQGEAVTRRLMPQFTLPPEAGKPYLSEDGFLSVIPDIKEFRGWAWITDDKGRKIKPSYRIGDICYIKEAWSPEWDNPNKVHFKFNDPWDGHDINFYDPHGVLIPYKSPWRSPLFMPAVAARHFVKVTDVKVELFRFASLTQKEIDLEGGAATVPFLLKCDGNWLWRVVISKVERPVGVMK